MYYILLFEDPKILLKENLPPSHATGKEPYKQFPTPLYNYTNNIYFLTYDSGNLFAKHQC